MHGKIRLEDVNTKVCLLLRWWGFRFQILPAIFLARFFSLARFRREA
jgi:hypothetical protein